MNRLSHLTAALITATAATLTAYSQTDDIRHYEIEVGDFSELRVNDGINVVYKTSADSCGIARFEASSDKASVIVLDNRKGSLNVALSDDAKKMKGLPTLTVYSHFLTDIKNSGDSLVKVESISPTAVFKAMVVGNGSIAVHGLDVNNLSAALRTGRGSLLLDGKANTARYNLLGTGSIQAADLTADNVRCNISGTGYIECHPLTKLNVISSTKVSSGKVYYLGNPEIKNNAIGIKVLPIE